MSPLNATFKALSDKNRRKILQLLKTKDRTAGEIAQCFNISKPSISHHLNLLKAADLVYDKRQGQHILYSLNTSVVEEVLNWFLSFTSGDKEGGNSDD